MTPLSSFMFVWCLAVMVVILMEGRQLLVSSFPLPMAALSLRPSTISTFRGACIWKPPKRRTATSSSSQFLPRQKCLVSSSTRLQQSSTPSSSSSDQPSSSGSASSNSNINSKKKSNNEKSTTPLASKNDNDNKRPFSFFYKHPLLLVRLAQRKALMLLLSCMTKFMALSRRAKRLVLAQVFLVMMLCALVVGPQTLGKVTSSHHRLSSNKTPIEIPYSSFLNLLRDQQQQQQAQVPPSPTTPMTITNVLIGKEKITFQIDRDALYSPTLLSATSNPTASSTTTTSKKNPTSSSSLSSSATTSKSTRHHNKKKKTLSPSSQLATAFTRHVPASPELVQLLHQHQVPFAAASTQSATIFSMALRSFLVTFYMLILWRMYRAVSGKGGGGTSTDSVGKLASNNNNLFGTSGDGNKPVTFDDIEGIDEAKFQVMELVDALKYPDKYAVLGARAPKGLLLEGPPGTGKTMLARATAAMAGVPLLYCSGSDFVEMFVGRGAARVRSTFERAKKLAPCILFIDELDALGKARSDPSSGMFRSSSGSNDEAEQTLNQLLACMDGLDSNTSTRKQICVLAATNRANVLDPALLRPGRFDRWVKLELPDSAGRERILRVHARKLPGFVESTEIDKNRLGSLGTDDGAVNLSAVAAVTVGLSGAELESIVNEAAIRAVRRVSAALAYLQRQDPQHHVPLEQLTTPHVESRDFEAAIAHFFQTRKPKNGVNDMLKNVWKA